VRRNAKNKTTCPLGQVVLFHELTL
jgi:hypothetical protein